jgi:thiol-disulfide isomerase/thioredoxin
LNPPDRPNNDQTPGNEETADLTAASREAQFPHTAIPGYTIKRVIASGGMGTVYEANQENPRRPVAIKVVKKGMATSAAKARFERETRALARLRHPGIAQIYEAGIYTDDGAILPFFALEYIPNASTLVEFAATRKLKVKQKLELFLQVCSAVHFGHQRGIIHRDLKPGNILVDSDGRVRIIDFGVARAIDSDQEQDDNQTRVGQFVGTAAYMSPEQFDADPNDLDTRSDVYTLGVVLFELLTGELPHDVKKSSIFEVAQTVRETPPRTVRKLVPKIDAELDLIVTKSLNKLRENRYQSAFGLAEDIRRHISGEAISARAPSLAYQVRVMARRNRAVTGLAVTTVAILVIGIIATTGLYFDVRDERAKSEEAAQQTIAANEFLIGALSSVVPQGYGDIATIGDLCDRVVADVDGALLGSPTTEADVRLKVGQIYRRLQDLDEAEKQLKLAYELRQEALGPTHEHTLEALHELLEYYCIFEGSKKCVETSEKFYALTLALDGQISEHTESARDELVYAYLVSGLYAKGIEYSRLNQRLTIEQYGVDSYEAIECETGLAVMLALNGTLDEALVLGKSAYEKIVEKGAGDLIDLNDVRNDYAAVLVTAGDLASAKELYRHQPAPGFVDVETEYQGQLYDLNKEIKIVVMFETWCPFSRRLMPKAEQLNREYAAHGIDFMGLTRVNRSSSDALVAQFIDDNQLTMPILRESGRTWNYFEATGTPFTVILHEGEVVLKTSGDGLITPALMEGLLAAH